MDYKELRAIAKEKFAGSCRVCPVCNGVACSGEVPGMGGVGSGAGFKNSFEALAGYRLNLRTVHAVSQPTLNCQILGLDLAMPILGAPIGGISINMKGALTEGEYTKAIVTGCRQAGTIGMTGDGPKAEWYMDGINAITAEAGYGIPIIKPRQTDKIIELANKAAEAGAKAFGIDIDAAALVNMTNAGQPVGPKTQADLEYIKKNTTIPFIVKGIMMPDEAALCAAAGVDAIVVSNHGGRALDATPGTAEVLPHIAELVKGKITILADGGIRSGVDVLKMLALGADAVLIGRPLAIGAVGGGAEGVALVLNKLAGELRTAMLLTGTADVAAVSEDVIW
ncbi:L-lactate dehydrogenase [bioreactor metagenome]|uniref:L-lactate dehydrogenase n=1 Tax=bioreactor metagenome TaxID=1076179 RepID=A0A644TLP0_9ZZZZ|nr:alpha-hydroxy-acid oxidizing protein [Negativicutes bacterium]